MQGSLNCRVRNAEASDLSGIVSVHISAFPGFFLTSLGSRFLKLMYASFISDALGVLLVSVAPHGAVVGFLASTRSPHRFFGILRRQKGFALGLAALPSVLRHPLRLLNRLYLALRYRGDAMPGLGGFWLLSSLGVAGNYAGSGVGSRLLEQFCSLARLEGAPGVYLLTDADNNEPTLAFYKRHGFVVHDEKPHHHGRRMLLLGKAFGNE
jgi:ribosomal protein S18 acetylase RimI-like enzyme